MHVVHATDGCVTVLKTSPRRERGRVFRTTTHSPVAFATSKANFVGVPIIRLIFFDRARIHNLLVCVPSVPYHLL